MTFDCLKHFPTNVTFINADHLDNYDQLTNYIIFIEDMTSEDRLFENIDRLGHPLVILHNSFSIYELPKKYNTIPVICIPIFAEFLSDDYRNIALETSLTKGYSKSNCFSFVLNRANINRYLCIKLVQHFKLESFSYTWSGCGRTMDLTKTINDMNTCLANKKWLTPEFKNFLLEPIQNFSENWKGSFRKTNHLFRRDYDKKNYENWELVKPTYTSSIIHLITGTPEYERATVVDEKFYQCVMGMNIPLWIGGGINQADCHSRHGIDVFDDIIDHSYQYCSTVVERCYRAFKDNLHLLQNFDQLNEIYQQILPRLHNNIKQLESNHFKEYNNDIINSLPMELQTFINNDLYNISYKYNTHVLK
jgi:hypothetical protein